MVSKVKIILHNIYDASARQEIITTPFTASVLLMLPLALNECQVWGGEERKIDSAIKDAPVTEILIEMLSHLLCRLPSSRCLLELIL